MPFSWRCVQRRKRRTQQYIAQLNEQRSARFGLPTEAEWEKAARGDPVNVRAQMEAEGVANSDFVEWANGRLENFFAHCLGSHIFIDPTEEALRALLASNVPLYGYRMFPTPTGAFDANVLWFDRKGTASVQDDAAKRRANASGVIDIGGNVWEWVADEYHKNAYMLQSPVNPLQQDGSTHCLRGASGFLDDQQSARAACRDGNHPGYRIGDVGLRLARAGSSQDS